MIKICKDQKEIANYKKLVSYAPECIAYIPISSNLFSEARQLFAKDVKLISVMNAEKNVFWLQEVRDVIQESNGLKREINTNYDGCNLKLEKFLDTTLMEQANIFVFYEIEEYTFAITEFIRCAYPYKKIVHLDANARYFWEESEQMIFLNSIWDVQDYQSEKCMYITSDNYLHNGVVPECISYVYNSKNVMNSLCWARKVSKYGPLHSNKIILLIDCDFGMGCGLAYIVRTVCIYAKMAHERGWVPVVNLTSDNMYIDCPTDNMWEQYFEPISEISVEEALKSHNVICIRENQLDYRAIWINPYFRSLWYQGAKGDVCIKRDIEKEFERSLPEPLKEKDIRVLGIFVRGTDMPGLEKSTYSTDAMIENCRKIMKEYAFDKIFLATEDKDYYDAFCEAFDGDVLSIEQKRVVQGKEEYKVIGRLLSIPQGERRLFGQTYLFVTYCLAQCNALLYNFPVGAYYLMNKWRVKPLEFEYQICNDSLHGESDVEHLLKCIEFIEQRSMTAIYGTGADAESLYPYLKKLQQKIVFCDRKAQQEAYLFHGCRVITPEEMVINLNNGIIDGIILATSCYGKEIKEELKHRGIGIDKIMWLKNERLE